MFTNKHIYSLKKDEFEKGSVDSGRLIANIIDIKFLSHLIIFPHFGFNCIQYLDLTKVSKHKESILEEFKGMQCEMIIGF